MKTLFVLAVLFSVVCGDVLLQILAADHLLASEGPTGNVLRLYEQLIRDLEKEPTAAEIDKLPNLYFKKALVSISLHKLTLAIADLRKCLSLNDQMSIARTKLVELLIERAEFALAIEVDPENEPSILEKQLQYTSALTLATEALSSHDYPKCLADLESGALLICTGSIEPYELRIKCLKAGLTEENKHDHFRTIVKDLNTVISLLPMQNLALYNDLSGYLLYTQGQFEQSWKFIKGCLRIDNDFKQCGVTSKFYLKYLDFLKQFERYSIINGYLYAQGDANTQAIDDEMVLSESEFKSLKQFFVDEPLKVSKLEKRKLPYSVSNNYDLLMMKAKTFQKEQGLEAVMLDFIQDLNRLACEAHVYTGDYLSSFCKLVEEQPNNQFFPKHVAYIDALLKKKKYDDAKELMGKFNGNLQKSALFQSRWQKIEDFDRRRQQQQQRRHQQQQQQQQQQRQQQYYQQQQQRQQQQQQQQQMMNSGVDYYKVLDVAKDADDKTIKKAYRTQTLKWHPDKYKGGDLTQEQMEEKMQEVNLAYEVLSDADKRRQYDQGQDPNNPNNGQGGRPNYGGQNFNFGGFGGFDGEQFFQDFMGGRGGFKFKFGG